MVPPQREKERGIISNTAACPDSGGVAPERLAQVESRLARVEAYLRLTPEDAQMPQAPASFLRSEEDLEFEVGQNWFAKVGIVVLAIGLAFMLSLPYADLSAGVPSLIGYALVAGLFVLVRLWRRALEPVSSTLRAVAMALLYFSTLRLFFFGAHPVLGIDSVSGRALLVVAVGINVAIALQRRSSWLLGLAMVMGYSAALIVGSSWFVLITITLLSSVLVTASLKYGRPSLVLFGIPLAVLTHFIWAINDPLLGRAMRLVTEPRVSLGFILAYIVIFAAGSFLRRQPEPEGVTNIGAMLNCAAGYGLYFVQSLAWVDSIFVEAQAIAAVVFIGLAAIFSIWRRRGVATFFYAMTGYAALSFAIIKSAPAPEVFVWLSLQSMVVVGTAIWFRSRFIIVANFFITLATVVGYMTLARRESGISLVFGGVALGTARLLEWQKQRLKLKTELMRNAYLVGAFFVFPYALYHVVPGSYVGLVWVGLALVYYFMNLVVRNRKYRWMGHATLLVTALYLMVIGISQLEPMFRNLSFLVLGTVLLVVSLIFTKLRMRRRANASPAPPIES